MRLESVREEYENRPINWGSSGKTVYDRTYSRVTPHGGHETWVDTVERVAKGNLALVYGEPDTWSEAVYEEYVELFDNMFLFKTIPAGRHLWATGVRGRQLLFNCHHVGWTDRLSDHVEFMFTHLLQGGGCGANYSLPKHEAPSRSLKVHIVCDNEHKDFGKLRLANTLSTEYVDDWDGAYQVEDSREGWANALSDLIDTFYASEVKHENRVYDVSRVRPEGSRLKTFGGTASGPVPFARMMILVSELLNKASARGVLTPLDLMEIDHDVATCVVAGGVRRSARMSILRWNDPYIFEFISCKTDTGKHWSTNISVEFDEDFFAALEQNDEHATAVLNEVSSAALKNGEPGVFNSALTNVGEIDRVESTNPCAEFGLVQFEGCNIAHVNLDAFAPQIKNGPIDEQGLFRAHQLMARFAIRATFGDITDAKQLVVQNKNRRIGVGHLGVEGFLAKQGIKYSAAPSNDEFTSLLDELYATVRTEAREYCFQLRIPECIKVTTAAPTGTIAKLAGVSEGIHAVYAKTFNRRIRFSAIRPEEQAQIDEFARQGYLIEDDIYDTSGNTKVVVFPTKDKLVAECEAMGYFDIVQSSDELSLEQMLAFQEMYQSCYADNAVSYTANIAENKYSTLQIAELLRYYLPRLKGTTIFPDSTRPQAPYERISQAEYELAEYLGSVDSSNDEECKTGCPIK
jgi:adenosylcobalamin-dependent ribonucleoside-triphosphate reductase